MEIEFVKDSIKSCDCIFAASVLHEETVETVVPDTLPDVLTILETDVKVELRSKELDEGRITVGARLIGTVLFVPEGEDGIRAVTLASQFTVSFNDPQLIREGKACIQLRCTAAETRMLNPRKLLLKAEILARAEEYAERETELITDARAEGLYTLQKSARIRTCAAVGEKTFVVAEELMLPTASGLIEELLVSRVSAAVEEIRPVAGKAVLQGRADAEILYLPENGVMPLTERFSVPFSQILDIAEESAECCVRLMTTACYVEPLPSGDGVSMELHMVAQTVCSEERELVYLSDAYSCRCGYEVEIKETYFRGIGTPLHLRDTVRALLQIHDTASEVIDCTVLPDAGEITGDTLRLHLSVTALYLTEAGKAASVQRRIECSVSLPEENGTMALSTVSFGEAYLAPAAGGLELRLPVEAELSCESMAGVCCVSSAELFDDRPCACTDRPSVLVVRCEDGDLWALAKRCGSTRELIEQANPQGITDGSFLLIPRAR